LRTNFFNLENLKFFYLFIYFLIDLGMECDRVQKKESRKFKGTGKTGDFTVELHKISLLRSVSWFVNL